MIYLIIYIVGVVIASFAIPKMFPDEENMWHIEDEGVREITEYQHYCDNIARILIWPLLALILIISFLIAIVGNLIEKMLKC